MTMGDSTLERLDPPKLIGNVTQCAPRNIVTPYIKPCPVAVGSKILVTRGKVTRSTQIKDAMELLTNARVLEHMMRGSHPHGIKLLPGDGNSLNVNATKISTGIEVYYRHPQRFIKWWGKAVGQVEGGGCRAMKKHSPKPQVLDRLDYSLPDPKHKWQNSGWEFALRVKTYGVSICVHFVRSQAVKKAEELPVIGLDVGGVHGPVFEEWRLYVVAYHQLRLQTRRALGDATNLLTFRSLITHGNAQHWAAVNEWVYEDGDAQPDVDAAPRPCIGEIMQRPLELCSWNDRESLPPVGKEYQQGYQRVNDRLPKGRQRLHRAAEYWRGIDGQARNNP
ncbi:hypothetical protein QJQ45_011212 [Haematococcus lacustris]|nr:hypothetical protein QJQ45_011212 [Haematococcus lacustris]